MYKYPICKELLPLPLSSQESPCWDQHPLRPLRPDVAQATTQLPVEPRAQTRPSPGKGPNPYSLQAESQMCFLEG